MNERLTTVPAPDVEPLTDEQVERILVERDLSSPQGSRPDPVQ